MIGVRGAGAAFLLPYLEIVFLKDVIETVVAHTVLLAKLLVVHLPQLAPAYTRVFTADFLDILHAESLIGQSGHQAVSMLVRSEEHTSELQVTPISRMPSSA